MYTSEAKASFEFEDNYIFIVKPSKRLTTAKFNSSNNKYTLIGINMQWIVSWHHCRSLHPWSSLLLLLKCFSRSKEVISAALQTPTNSMSNTIELIFQLLKVHFIFEHFDMLYKIISKYSNIP